MRNPYAPAVGGVLSCDIAVPDHEREVAFYAKILTTGSSPFWRDDLMNNEGTPIIGLGVRTADYADLPLQWMPHIQVADVAASVERTLEVGGSELMHGKNDAGESEWAVLQDGAGAAFGLVTVVGADEIPSSPTDSIGHIAWLRLVCADPSATSRFYEHVIGWSAAPSERGQGFEMRRPDGGSSAEIYGPSDLISHVWLISLPVGDLEESLRLAREGGGEVLEHSPDSGDAVIRDPVGVCIALQENR